jgi:hypothetical protein
MKQADKQRILNSLTVPNTASDEINCAYLFGQLMAMLDLIRMCDKCPPDNQWASLTKELVTGRYEIMAKRLKRM